jgi:DNA-binding NarL/FixJ family response regulator
VLLLEDSAADAELMRYHLDGSGVSVIAERVETRDAFSSALRGFKPHVVLSENELARFDALAALKLALAERPAAPFIVVFDTVDEQAAVTCLRRGADNIVLKSNLGRLKPVIDDALAVRRPLEQLSPRQLEVLRLVADGHTTREIAKRFQLSAKTIESHRGEVMKRLGIHDVVNLVRYAVRVGLVPAGGERG